MGDFNLNYLSRRERDDLDTILVPYNLAPKNKTLPTRVHGKSKTLLDYIIQDNGLPRMNCLVCETNFKTDHLATLLISNQKYKINNSNTVQKTVFDRKSYNIQLFRQTLNNSNWSQFYQQTSAEDHFTAFSSIVEKALKKHAPLKTVYIRNNKTKVEQKRLDYNRKVKQLQRKKAEAKKIGDDTKYKFFQNELESFMVAEQLNMRRHLLETSDYKKKWKFINELRGIDKSITLSSLKNSFGEVLTSLPSILNLLNYRFSNLGMFYDNKDCQKVLVPDKPQVKNSKKKSFLSDT